MVIASWFCRKQTYIALKSLMSLWDNRDILFLAKKNILIKNVFDGEINRNHYHISSRYSEVFLCHCKVKVPRNRNVMQLLFRLSSSEYPTISPHACLIYGQIIIHIIIIAFHWNFILFCLPAGEWWWWCIFIFYLI